MTKKREKIDTKPLKFLTAVSSEKYSKPTLTFGSLIASVFDASMGVAYVGKKASEFHGSSVNLTRQNLTDWNIIHPGLEVLQWALKELKKLNPENEALAKIQFNPDHVYEEDGRIRVFMPDVEGKKIELVLREGELVGELRKEMQLEKYDLAIIGGSQNKRNLAHSLIQYLPGSIFVLQKFNPRKKYKLLLLVDDSTATAKSVEWGALIAEKLGWPVRTLTVSKTSRFGAGYQGAADMAKAYFDSRGIDVEQFFLTGDPVRTFVEFAGDNHIVIMGASTLNPLKQFLFGSKPIQTLKQTDVPILIVR
ncbi:MAG: universal stress protein [Candidatus Marinimicrobia bacterium]|nr:universal stress protein [Candidatus Neomarinimicrobiota bacterium]MCF7850303.1 universal stress protein [Candidatus Neomarinimicrobiota bacterium]MCF7903895.1 universal stress protein [Candidatus Neomarinimicrobiota bacterium]